MCNFNTYHLTEPCSRAMADHMTSACVPSLYSACSCHFYPGKWCTDPAVHSVFKVNIIDQISPTSTNQWLSLDGHKPIVRTFVGQKLYHSGQYITMHPYTYKAVIHFIFWQLSIIAIIHFLNNVLYKSSSMGSGQMNQILLPKPISEFTGCPSFDHRDTLTQSYSPISKDPVLLQQLFKQVTV